MADWQIVRFDPTYEEPLDVELIPLLDSLNAAGFVTTSSCCGHGHNWPFVFFEHSTDERIESMARHVLRRNEGSVLFFPRFRKEIWMDGYDWALHLHLVEAFGDTQEEEFLRQSIEAINITAAFIDEWAYKGRESR
jgi:hypothetical protein